MFSDGALRAFVHTLDVQVTQLTDAQARAALVQTATAERDRVLAGTPHPTGYRQIVDGAEGAPLESVRPDGVIVFAWQYLGVVVEDTLGALANRLPVRTGALRESVMLLIDGQEGRAEEIGIATAEVRIVVSADYARRIERGRKARTHDWFSEKGHTAVEETAITAQSLYKDVATIAFGYVELSDSPELSEAARYRRFWKDGVGWRRSTSKRKRFGVEESRLMFPCITITPRVA